MSGPVEPWAPWTAAMGAVREFQKALVDLRLDPAATVRAARLELAKGSERDAMTVLQVLGTAEVQELVDPLLEVALSDRYTETVRELLGRLPRYRAEEIVPPAVWRLLEKEGDDGYAYRRMAELLHHLGLDDALKELCRVAYDSIDPDVREVASDFA